MEHIKTPVEIDALLGIVDADKRLVCETWLIGGADAEAVEAEIAAVLNERDELIAQRDALMRIAEAVIQVRDDWYPYRVPGYLQRLAAQAEGALALVEAADA